MSDDDITRQSPHSLDAEQALLGSMILSEKAIARAIQNIPDIDYFYYKKHRVIFNAIRELYDENQTVNEITLPERLTRKDQLDEVGGSAYIGQLIEMVPHEGSVEHYVDIIREKYVLRALIDVCSDIIEESYQDPEQIDELLDNSEKKFFNIKQNQGKEGFRSASNIVDETFEDLKQSHDKDGAITGLRTGFSYFDELTSGLQENQLIIVAARPGMGKTSLALTMARNIGLNRDSTVGIFSLEMSQNALVKRLLSGISKIPHRKLNSGNLSDEDFQRLGNAMARIGKAEIHLNDNPSLGVLDMKTEARQLKSKHGLDLILVDYLQLMKGPRNANSREQELATISRGLKEMAMELEIPVIALTQLNRKVENRSDKRPKLADLRGSGAIEQDADVVAFVYREHYYTEKPEDEGRAEIILGKQRNGPTDTVELSFIGECMTFEEMSHRKI
ncbi:MAG: replicative DNA helicase [bacterium]